MKRFSILVVGIVVFLLMVGCSGHIGTPIEPGVAAPSQLADAPGVGNCHLWGYYSIYFDPVTGKIEITPDRSVMFAANVVSFVNNSPANLSFQIISTLVSVNYIDVDINVSIAHPFPGMSQYDGYDVRVVFSGDGSKTLEYDSSLRYPVVGTDQFMMDDPVNDDGGGPDGYTRWFNPAEFGTPGLFGYTPGIFASKNYNGNARLMPYKYFANGLGSSEELWGFLEGTDDHGVFKSGAKNTRNYYLRFPKTKGVKYGYAILANWFNEATHPANAPEPVACDVVITDNIYYVNDSDFGGDLILDISIWGWLIQPDAIYIESNMLNDVYMLDAADMTPTGGTETWSTYHVKIPTDTIPGVEGNEFWVIAELADYDYTNDFGVPNGAGTDPLAAFFRYDVYTSPKAYNKPPEIVSGVAGEEMPADTAVETYTVEATDPDMDPLNYTWTVSYPDTGDPVTGYDGVAGNVDGTIDIDFGEIGEPPRTELNIDCLVDDGTADPVPAETLTVRIIPAADWYVSNNSDFAALPQTGTRENPFHTISNAIASSHDLGDTFLIDFGTYNEQVYFSYGIGCTLYGFDWYTEDSVGNGRPILQYGTAGPLMIDYTYNVTVRGLTIQFSSGASAGYLIRNYYSHSTTIMDCLLTGETSAMNVYAAFSDSGDDFTFTNNKIAGFGRNGTSNVATVYSLYVRYGAGSHDVSRNEITNLQPTTPPNLLILYGINGYYWPAGSKCNNNLIHHIAPTTGSDYYVHAYMFYIRNNYPITEVAHNTIDQLSIENSSNINSRLQNIYLSYAGTGRYNIHSNIITSPDYNNSLQYIYGIYSRDSSDYCDLWDFPTGSYVYQYYDHTPGPHCISQDPLYNESETWPYDYTLQDGSPCIGAGKNGEDMGCWGGLEEGQVVGLISPE